MCFLPLNPKWKRTGFPLHNYENRHWTPLRLTDDIPKLSLHVIKNLGGSW